MGKCHRIPWAAQISSPTACSSRVTEMDFQNRSFWMHLAQPAGGIWIFDEKIQIFDTKLCESTRNWSQMFSGGVGDVGDALSRVCALSGGENPKKLTKTPRIWEQIPYCALAGWSVAEDWFFEIFHDFSFFSVFVTELYESTDNRSQNGFWMSARCPRYARARFRALRVSKTSKKHWKTKACEPNPFCALAER